MAPTSRKRIKPEDEQPADAEPIPQGEVEAPPAKPIQDAPPIPTVAAAHDEEDLPDAQQRETHDGKGEGEIPPPDFAGFATDDVDRDTTVARLASEVLRGSWGSYAERRDRLRAAGYDPSEVERAANKRRSGGAPSSHTPSVRELAIQVIRGEWGTKVEQEQRLRSAGFNYKQISEEVDRQLGN